MNRNVIRYYKMLKILPKRFESRTNMNTKFLKISTLGAYVVMVLVNFLAVLLPIGGRDTGEISDNYPNLFAPAGYAFSIWGLIYTLLAIYVIYQLWRGKDQLVARINRLFILNTLLNASWIFAWHYDVIWLSVLIMAGLLFTLIRIADILRLSDLNVRQSWLVRLPFSVYFGWITVATIANITVFLVYLGWNGFGLSESFWTVVVLLVGMLIGCWRMLWDRFIPYGLVLIWAYGAILFKHLSVKGFAGNYQNVIFTTILSLMVFLGVIIFIFFNRINIPNFKNKLPERNIGVKDRIFRFALSIIIGAGSFFVEFIIIKLVLILLSLFILYEALVGWCAFYALLGKNTCHIDLKKNNG